MNDIDEIAAILMETDKQPNDVNSIVKLLKIPTSQC